MTKIRNDWVKLRRCLDYDGFKMLPTGDYTSSSFWKGTLPVYRETVVELDESEQAFGSSESFESDGNPQKLHHHRHFLQAFEFAGHLTKSRLKDEYMIRLERDSVFDTAVTLNEATGALLQSLKDLVKQSPADPLQDNRSFARFVKEEKLVEVTRDYTKFAVLLQRKV